MIKLFKKGSGLCLVNFFTGHKPCPLKNGFMPPNAFYWLGNNDKWPYGFDTNERNCYIPLGSICGCFTLQLHLYVIAQGGACS